MEICTISYVTRQSTIDLILQMLHTAFDGQFYEKVYDDSAIMLSVENFHGNQDFMLGLIQGIMIGADEEDPIVNSWLEGV